MWRAQYGPLHRRERDRLQRRIVPDRKYSAQGCLDLRQRCVRSLGCCFCSSAVGVPLRERWISRFKVDVDVLWRVRRRYRRAPHGIELEGGVKLVAGPMTRKGKVHLLASEDDGHQKTPCSGTWRYMLHVRTMSVTWLSTYQTCILTCLNILNM